MEEDKMGKACSTHGNEDNFVQNCGRKTWTVETNWES